MTAVNRIKPVRLPKPRVTPLQRTAPAWDVDFGDGVTGCVFWAGPDCYRWQVARPDGRFPSGKATTDAHAFRWAWQAAARAVGLPAVADLTSDGCKALAERAMTSANEAAKVLRGLLRRRTGFAWSVTVDRGSSRGRITIHAAPERRVDGSMTPHDAAVLAAVLDGDVNWHNGVSVDRTRTARREYVYKVAGFSEQRPT